MAQQRSHSSDGPGAQPAPAADLGMALVTGGAKRIGAAVARALHAAGHPVLIHAHHSLDQAQALAAALNAQRPDSAATVQADLRAAQAPAQLFAAAAAWRGPVQVLVNNASTYYATPLAQLDARAWDDLRGSNLDAPLWLSQAFAAQAPHGGCIINLIDSQVPRGIAGHAAYAAAKAGQLNLTRSLAKELAPALRVNAVAPGAILWPEPPPPLEKQRELLAQIPLGRLGEEAEIAEAVCFLVRAHYITGQVLAVDGGRGL